MNNLLLACYRTKELFSSVMRYVAFWFCNALCEIFSSVKAWSDAVNWLSSDFFLTPVASLFMKTKIFKVKLKLEEEKSMIYEINFEHNVLIIHCQ